MFILVFGAQPFMHDGVWGQAAGPLTGEPTLLIDDFNQSDGLPQRWKAWTGKSLRPLEPRDFEPHRSISIQQGTAHLRTVNGIAHMGMATQGDDIAWNVRDLPILSWRWKAHIVPDRANERSSARNDVAAAVYVFFDFDWLNRPRALKYTYSSTLPVGTTVDQGSLKVIVVSSAADGLRSAWESVRVNVVEDYKRLFDRDPPQMPLMIRIWSDTDSTEDASHVEIDDLVARAR
jgi:hypothetical protein